MTALLIDGEPLGMVPASDRGLNYGDGLFETCAVRRGEPLLWARHLERLARGCRQLRLPLPDQATLTTEATALCRGHERAVLKVLITRGAGGRGYKPPSAVAPRRVLSLHEWPQGVEERALAGIRVRLCATPVSANAVLARIKHTSRLENVAARAEWTADDPVEGLMTDGAGQVVEATAANVFLVEGPLLVTPGLARGGVAGIMREVILEVAAGAGLPVAVEDCGLERVRGADEVFLCNSVAGIWPVTSFDGTAYPVGPATRRLQGLLARRRAVAYPAPREGG